MSLSACNKYKYNTYNMYNQATTNFKSNSIPMICLKVRMKCFNMSSQRHKRGSLLLSSRCMTNYVKTCSFLHAHCTETMKVVENLFQRELMMKNIFNHIMYVTICRFLPPMYMFWVYSHCKTLNQSACADPKGGEAPPP